MVRTVFIGAALMLAANVASAQITTYMAPPKPLASSPQMVAAADSVRGDSLAQAAMTNMKVWVDSAAGVTVPAYVGDSTVADPGRPEVITTFADGSVAPATASALPTLVLLGAFVSIVGAILLATRQRG